MEGAELMPSEAKLLGGRTAEAAHVGAHVGDAEKVEFLTADHRNPQVLPVGVVVAEPMSCVPARRHKS